MKVFHHAYHSDGGQIDSPHEILDESFASQQMLKVRERGFNERYPGQVHFRLSVIFENTDGQFYENVPRWKSELAATLVQQHHHEKNLAAVNAVKKELMN